MNWIFLAVVGAFAQALGMAIKKKTLQTPGMNNVIGFLSFTTAGLIFGALLLFTRSSWPEHISVAFLQSMFWYAGLNVIAIWFLYKAIDSAEFNFLMPFMTLTSLSMIIPPMIILGEIPSQGNFIGILFIVIGALWMNYRPIEGMSLKDEQLKRDNQRGLWYFLVTAICFTIVPTATKVAVQETSVLFTSLTVHLLIGMSFLVITLVSGEFKKITAVVKGGEFTFLRNGILLAGLVIVIENGSISTALGMAPVASVMALKRLMPFFAFFIGYFYFKEQSDIRKKLFATVSLIIGAILISVF